MISNNKCATIIIPHKDIPNLLDRCLSSIPNRNDLQIIVVDDNSDSTIVDFNNFPGKDRSNVEIYFSKKSFGSGYSRNIGLEKAVGKWIIFADADDFFCDGFNDILNDYYHNEEDILYFNIKSVYSNNITKPANRNSSKIQLFENYESDINSDDVPFRINYPEPWGKFFKLDFLLANNILFDEVMVSNDYYFSVKAGCLASKIKIVNKYLYTVTLRQGSLSINYADSLEKLLIRLSVAIRVQILIKNFGYDLKPMPIRGLMVLLFKRDKILFLKKLILIKKERISITRLFYQMFSRKYRGI